VTVREDIHELTNDELADSIDGLAVFFREEMAAPRTAETLVEAAKRLRAER
jgi:DeoR/GlpR family transcriptional regulator of sugar metabolism